jgi:hypothetical protein
MLEAELRRVIPEKVSAFAKLYGASRTISAAGEVTGLVCSVLLLVYG